MKAVVLAAGEGARCRPLTFTRSKVMLPIANKPILEYVVDALSSCGINEIVMVVGYKKELIMDYFRDGVDFDVSITYEEQKAILGTAHALNVARQNIEDGESFLVINGDTIINAETVMELLQTETPSILGVLSELPSQYGVIIEENGKLKSIIEKPKEEISYLVNSGIYLFDSSVFDYVNKLLISDQTEYSLTDVIQLMIEDDVEIGVMKSNALWLDVVYPWDVLTITQLLLKEVKTSLKGKVEEGARIIGNVVLGEGSIVRSGCYIVGPTVIGRNCEIGANTTILPSTTIGDNTTISTNSHIENSVLFGHSFVQSGAFISNSIIASSLVSGSHLSTEVADKPRVEVEDDVMRCPKKLGAIVGDDCSLGSGVILTSGSVIGGECVVSSGKIIRGYLPLGSKVV
ncbi:glucose-1-phosphate thymidylyltransferase [Methanosarcinales archaeon]|nr:MAG: glucose-1-phosphate thymidylyltransferase [Methanosarcinales archaeon]